MTGLRAYSAASGIFSLLNPVDIDPHDVLTAQMGATSQEGNMPANSVPTKRQYKCDVCDKLFNTSGHLTRHVRVHTGIRSHACPFPNCDKRCSRHDNLIQHFHMHFSKDERERGSVYIRSTLASMTAAREAALSMQTTETMAPSLLASSPAARPSTDDAGAINATVVPSRSPRSRPGHARRAEFARSSSRSTSPLSSTLSGSPITPAHPSIASESSSLSSQASELKPSTGVATGHGGVSPSFLHPSPGLEYEVSHVRTDRD